ncbi:MAG: flagellar filament outer layer protein FlaA, partial [Spirochaetota bacterium]
RGIGVSILLVLLLTAAAGADEVTRNWQSIVLEDFDDGDSQWIVRGGKFLAVADEDGDGEPDNDYDYPFEYQIVDGVWPEDMGEPESENPGVLGVQAAFTRRGYNYLEFVPIEDEPDEDGNPVPRAIAIPGRPEAIDVWAWGSNYDYYLEVQVRDYRGIVHNLKLGNLGYAGWRNLVTDIPNYIPRAVRFVPQRRRMELVKVVLWTRPEESVAGFHFYLDQIKVLTDMFETGFDGEQLAEPGFVQEVWGTEQRQ